MPYYHATRRSRLREILREGLHGRAEQNFECERGVYLSTEPIIAVGFLLEKFLESEDPAKKPSEEIEDFVIIVIDDSRVNKKKLKPDPNVEEMWQEYLFLHQDDIDVNGMPLLDVEQVFTSNKSLKHKS